MHVYNASHFLMYTRCKHLKPHELSGDGHSVDYFFVRAVLEHAGRPRRNDRNTEVEPTVRFVPPHRAQLFVLPVMCSQSLQGLCGGCRHHEHVWQLHAQLNRSVWYQRRGGAGTRQNG